MGGVGGAAAAAARAGGAGARQHGRWVGGGRFAFELSFCLGFGRSGVCSCWVGVDWCRELGGWLLAWLGLSS